MIRKIIYIFFGCFLIVSVSGYSQDTLNPAGYFFDGDEVVFQFDSRQYQKATLDGTSDELDFVDLDVYDVIVSGEFNDWSRRGWRMKRVGPTIYELRKNIEDFDDAFTWDFKFLINGKYWAEPTSDVPNKVKVQPDKFWKDVFNLSLYTVRPAEDGNGYFFLKGHEDASEVLLTGSFIGWDETRFKMKKVSDGWELRLDLDAGRHEYKYIVDGSWLEIPQSEEKVMNVHGTFNSVIHVSKPVTLKLKGHSDAEKVVVAGSFNNWSLSKDPMTQIGEEWVISIDLQGGKYHYKFIVDGEWLVDPSNALKEKDREGNVNSVLLVR